MTGDALRRSLDLPARAKESFKRHRPTWLSGAAILGFVLSKLPARSKTVFVERATGKALGVAGKVGALFSAAKFAMKFAGPVIADLAGGSIAEILKRFQRTAKPPDPANPGTTAKP
jgi:hypothetical protein